MDDDDRLLAYVQGRLSDADKIAFEADLAKRPDLNAELKAMQGVTRAIEAEEVDPARKANGWARLESSIKADRLPVAANDNRRLSVLQAVGLAVAAVFAWQIIALPFLPVSDAPGFSTASVDAEGVALRVAFSQSVSIAEVTDILKETGATITDGPSAIGLFTLEFADDATRQAAEAIFAERPDLFTTVSRP